MTNVFISWSGDRSKEIAEELRSWIPSVLQFAKPYFTPNDIEKGTKWNAEISKRLNESNVGIICLTKENYEKPWILFEAGALSKDLESSRVCSILFGMENTDLTGPLTTFQTTEFDKSDFKKLMSTINDAGDDRALTRETFDTVFEMWWPKLQEKISKILEKEIGTTTGEVRSERDILEEILDLSRMSARRTSSQQRVTQQVPMGWMANWISTLSDIIDIYERSEDKELHGAISEQLELCRYLVASSEKFESEFGHSLRNQMYRFENIIPF